jgi:hypothetical protein
MALVIFHLCLHTWKEYFTLIWAEIVEIKNGVVDYKTPHIFKKGRLGSLKSIVSFTVVGY